MLRPAQWAGCADPSLLQIKSRSIPVQPRGVTGLPFSREVSLDCRSAARRHWIAVQPRGFPGLPFSREVSLDSPDNAECIHAPAHQLPVLSGSFFAVALQVLTDRLAQNVRLRFP
jgi:hypothetical protein